MSFENYNKLYNYDYIHNYNLEFIVKYKIIKFYKCKSNIGGKIVS